MGAVTERLAILVTVTGAQQAQGEVKRLGGAFGGLSTSQAAYGAAALAAGKFLLSSAQAASNLNEQVTASKVIFGDGAASVQQFAQTAVDSFGLSQRAALEASNNFAAFFKQAGVGSRDVATMSTTLTKLAADVASFRNLQQADVLEKFRSGLAGETKALRDIAIDVSDARVQTKAMEMGLASANGTVDQGGKVLARYALILEQTKDAQGDYARTSSGLANSQRTLGAQFENLQATVGEALTPSLAELTSTLGDLIEVADKVTSPFGGLATTLANVEKFAIGALTPLGGLVQILGGDHASAADKAAAAQKDYADQLAATSSVQRAATQSAEEQAAAAEAVATAEQKLTKATRDRRNAEESLGDSVKATERAQRDEADASKAVDDLLRRGAVDAEAVARAKEQAAQASKAVTQAQQDEADASQRVADLTDAVTEAQDKLNRVKQGASARDLAKAELADAAAHRAKERAAIGLSKAQDDVNAGVQVGIVAAGQHVTTAIDQRSAELDLADALDEVKLADIRAQEEDENLQQVRDQGKDGSKDLKDAQKELKDKTDDLNKAVGDLAQAHQNVADRQRDQIKAGEDLRKAEEGDPDFADKLRDARQKLADAHDDVARAKRNERDATEELQTAEENLAASRQARSNTSGNVVSTSAIDNQDFRPVRREAGATTGTFGPIILQINGAELARVTADEIAKQQRRNGGR